MSRNEPCPCGTGKKYKTCCGLNHMGIQYPQDAERMIRSRYTAYVIGDVDYLHKTTHPSNEAVAGKTADKFKQETLAYCQKVDFTKLTVHKTEPEDERGISRGLLSAWFKLPGLPEDFFTERSEFITENGKLLYLAGTEVEPPPQS